MASVELSERGRDAEVATGLVAPRAAPDTGTENLVHEADSRIGQQLPPVDGGFAAWRLLFAAFMFEACLWGTFIGNTSKCKAAANVVIGFPLSYGVFQQYYSTVPEFAGNKYVGVVGTIASGLGYLGAPIVMPFIQRNERWVRPMVWVGCKSKAGQTSITAILI